MTDLDKDNDNKEEENPYQNIIINEFPHKWNNGQYLVMLTMYSMAVILQIIII